MQEPAVLEKLARTALRRLASVTAKGGFHCGSKTVDAPSTAVTCRETPIPLKLTGSARGHGLLLTNALASGDPLSTGEYRHTGEMTGGNPFSLICAIVPAHLAQCRQSVSGPLLEQVHSEAVVRADVNEFRWPNRRRKGKFAAGTLGLAPRARGQPVNEFVPSSSHSEVGGNCACRLK
jgi:hypothetical protein